MVPIAVRILVDNLLKVWPMVLVQFPITTRYISMWVGVQRVTVRTGAEVVVAVILDSDQVISVPILAFRLFNQMVKSGEGGDGQGHSRHPTEERT